MSKTKALAELIRISKYARYNKDKKRRETWPEQVKRVVDMHRDYYKDFLPVIEEDINFVEQMMIQKRILGSQRALQFGGAPIIKHNAKSYNCSFSHVDRVEFFQQSVYALLCGCGVGFSVQTRHVSQLPEIAPRTKGIKVHVVADSIEGWSDAAGVLMSSYFVDNGTLTFSEYSGYEVDFDFTQIRPKGSIISSSGAKAPGPKALANSLRKIRHMLDETTKTTNKLRPIDAHDIICHLSDCVLSGGIRRSSLISLFSYDDEEMMNCKIGNWFENNPQRARANNSVVLHRKEVTEEQFKSIISRTKEFGEPGFYFVDDYDFGTNPCCLDGDTLVTMSDGSSKKIKDIIEGEQVLSYNLETEQSEPKYVTFSDVTRLNAEVVELVFDDGETLICTPDHKIFTTNRGYVEASELEKEDTITEDTSLIQINEVSSRDVYDIEVSDNHNFYANGVLVHNCEIGLYPKTEDGRSGFQFCNLSTINMKKVKTKEDFFDSCRAAAIIGTLQAGYTKFEYLGKATEEITSREALLGVSMTGLMDCIEVGFDPEVQREGGKVIKETNERLAMVIGINPAARTQCVKPEGTTSLMLGTSSGVHPHHSRRYFRRVQKNQMEKTLQFFKQYNPLAVEKSVWSANGTDEVITFVCEVPASSKTKVDIDAMKLLELVKTTQENWVLSGVHTDRCVKPGITHNVSNTIHVKAEEWDTVSDYIFNNRQFFSGVSLLSNDGDKDYQQAPYTSVYTPKEIVARYGDGSLMLSGLIVDGLRGWSNNLWNACDDVIFNNVTDKTQEQKDWIRRVNQFCERYMNGDIKQTCYAMKDVHNWKIWCDLSREYQEVPWDQMIEEEDSTKLAEVVACGGGGCEVI